MSINKSDIITCKSYEPLCDYRYAHHEADTLPDLDDIPPTGIVHVPLEHIEEFFERIDSNGHRYVVVSPCSDYGLAIQQEHPAWKDMLTWTKMQVGPSFGYSDYAMPARIEKGKCNIKDTYSIKCHSWTRATIPKIPHNVHHWFMTNLMFVPEPETYEFLYEGNMYEKLTAIPFGIAQGKADLIHQAMQNIDVEKKKNKIYVSWNDYTYERYDLRQDLVEWQAYAGNDSLTWRRPVDGQDTYEDYIENLRTHKYVVSPKGNGADCYRTLESIYMKCFTFVEDTPTNYLTDLPVYKYKTVDDIIRCYNDDGYSKMKEGFHIDEKVKLSYWENLIKDKAAEMFV